MNCRICGSFLRTITHLGEHAIASRFPLEGEHVPTAPLSVSECSNPKCGLLQLGQTVDPSEIWRDGYGYQSGLSQTMRDHLSGIVADALPGLYHGAVVLDIGCNDGTLLRAWGATDRHLVRIGFDPLAEPVAGAKIHRDYFSLAGYRRAGCPNANIVTSIAMFYDLDNPLGFARDIASILAPGGIWICEVAYLGDMLKGAWDGICHEHLCYYGLKQLREIGRRAGLFIKRVTHNTINGGSLQVWFMRGTASVDEGKQAAILEHEEDFDIAGLDTTIKATVLDIKNIVSWNNRLNLCTYVLGASTKGNTLMQACDLGGKIAAAVERNPAKVGKRTPGTNIPIISEEEARNEPPHAFLVLPWHFKDEILKREADLVSLGVKFIFPLPTVTTIN